MTRNDLYLAFQAVDDDLLERSQNVKKNRSWKTFGTIAACLCLIIGIALPVMHHKGVFQGDYVDPIRMLEFDGAYYEVIDLEDIKILDKFNLPHEITSSMVGDAVGTGLEPTGEETEQIFYQYLPVSRQECPQRALYVVRDGSVYSFALFCNFVHHDTNAFEEVSELFAVYGIDEAADIAVLTIGDEKITDSGKIQVFYDAMCTSYAMGNDDFQLAVFQRMEEEKQQALSIVLADSMIKIQLETTAGMVLPYICYYPTIQYVSWALNYYQLDEPITE